MASLLETRECQFSDDRVYRYSLKIIWDPALKPQMFVGLNPSTADEENDDPTVRRCKDFARQWGAGGLIMANACAYRATDPEDMLRYAGDQIGPENTVGYLEKLAAQCQNKPIAAWGRLANEVHWWKTEETKDLRTGTLMSLGNHLKCLMGPLDCLRLNQDGSPAHPLYLPRALRPIPFNY